MRQHWWIVMNIVETSVYIMANRSVVLYVSHIISDVYIEQWHHALASAIHNGGD